MRAVLLAAGFGSRLRPLTTVTPKCLVPINGKPLLDYWLDMLVASEEIDEIYVNLHYKPTMVKEHLRQNWSQHRNIHTWYEPELSGTAGTLADNYEQIKGQDCLVIHADNLSVFPLHDFLAQHSSKTAITMMLFHTDQPSQCGIVELDEQNRVLNMHEKVAKPPGNLANGAVYVFSPEVLDFIHQQQVTDISEDVIPHFHGNIVGWLNQQYHRDIGNPKSYQQANEDVLNRPDLFNCH